MLIRFEGEEVSLLGVIFLLFKGEGLNLVGVRLEMVVLMETKDGEDAILREKKVDPNWREESMMKGRGFYDK